MQTLAQSVWRALAARTSEARLIAHSGSNVSLPLWLAGALPSTAMLLARRSVNSILTGDALTYASFEPLFRTYGVRATTMVMGLDVSYRASAYRAVVHPALRRAPQVIAISRATAQLVASVGVPEERITVLRLGIDLPPADRALRDKERMRLRARYELPADVRVIATVGRLIPRKGVAWFVRTVLPRLPEHIVYLVAGEGPDEERIRVAIAASQLESRVLLLGSVDDQHRHTVLAGADVYVQPNLPVPGDIEGFGLTAVEAAARGTPTVASAIEGLLDAVAHGETGILLPPGDETVWERTLRWMLKDPARLAQQGEQFMHRTRELYGEEQMGAELIRLLAGGPSAGRAS